MANRNLQHHHRGPSLSLVSRRTRLGILGPAALPVSGSHMIPRPAYCLHPARPPHLDVGAVTTAPGQPHSAQCAHRNPQLPHPPSTGYRTIRLPSIPRSPRPSPGLLPVHPAHPPQVLLCNPPHRSTHIRRPTRAHSTAISICDDAHPRQRSARKRSGVRSPCCPFKAVSVFFQVSRMHPGAHFFAPSRALSGPVSDRALRP